MSSIKNNRIIICEIQIILKVFCIKKNTEKVISFESVFIINSVKSNTKALKIFGYKLIPSVG